MHIRKAVITAAGRRQRTLPMQTLFDQHGSERSVLSLIVREALGAGVDDICIVASPGDEGPYTKLLTDDAVRVTFVPQTEPRGYADAVLCARGFVNNEPFLHLVGDHVYVGANGSGCAKQLVDAANAEGCAVSGVQVTRESLLPLYGTVGGQPLPGRAGFYRVDAILEKPTPTEAEQRLIVPGLRSGHYLCFFGMHVLTPQILEILDFMQTNSPSGAPTLSASLAVLAQREQYLAMIQSGRRFDVGVKYGLFTAQLALAQKGDDREEVLAHVIDVLADRETSAAKGGAA